MKPRQLTLGLLSVVPLVGFALFRYGPAPLAAGQQTGAACCDPNAVTAPRELDFPYYSLRDGFNSTLNLVSDSPKPLDFVMALHSISGQTLLGPQMTIQTGAKLPIDLGGLLQSLNADPGGPFAEGSISIYFQGTIMPLVGQLTITNPANRLVHESEMVENDPGRSDIPAVLNGIWWGLSGGRDARFMVANMSGQAVTADVFLDFAGERHQVAPTTFAGHETKVLSVAGMLAALNVSASQAPEGGITIIQRGPYPALIAQGRVTDPVTGFSTTLEFPDPARQAASALHASGIPIGTPSKDSPFAGLGSFTPHVIARNLLNTPQTLTVTVEYPKSSTWNSANGPGGSPAPDVRVTGPFKKGDKNPNEALDHPPNPDPSTLTGQLTLAPLAVGPYSTVDFSVDAVLSQLPLPLAFCSVRIQYSGPPGSMVAQVSSVDARQDLVVDAHAMNEGDGWAGSGANPWHLDDSTDSILFLTNEGEKPARIGFSVTANDVHYFLTSLKLAPHESRAINLRRLRDAQKADFKKNTIPAGASDGAVNWIRLDNVVVSGRLVVINRGGRVSSDYDCNVCYCPATYSNLTVEPSSFNVLPNSTFICACTAWYTDCNGNITATDVASSADWISRNTSVATVAGGFVTGQSAGRATIDAFYTDYIWYYNSYARSCNSEIVQRGSSTTCTVGAYPVNFSQSTSQVLPYGVLYFAYTWGSSTGNKADLSSCTVSEYVTYQNCGSPTCTWPQPPWNYSETNPFSLSVPGSDGQGTDYIDPGKFDSSPPYATVSNFTATQIFQYSCYNGALTGNLTGNISIVRNVTEDSSGVFTYTGTKSGISSSCTVPSGCSGN